MNKPEIMNCAAILAAGMISIKGAQTTYTAESAVDLMMQLADKISEQTKEPEREYRQL